MSSMLDNSAPPFSRSFVLFLLICGLASSAAVFWSSSRYGLGFSTDSVSYIASARSLAAGHGVISSSGSPLIVQPPLYPATLAVVSILSGVDAPAAARYLNAVLLCFIIWATGYLVLRLLSHPAVAMLGILSIFFSVPFHNVSLSAWSEPLFIFFSLLCIVFLSRYVRRPRPLSLILFIMMATAASLTRYIGVIFIAIGCLSIITLGQGDMRRRLQDAAFSLASVAPLLLWLMRNEIVSDTLFGPRAPSQHSLVENVALTVIRLLAWYLPLPPKFTATDALSLISATDAFSLAFLAICAICVICLLVVWVVALRRLGLFLFFRAQKGVSLGMKIPPEISVSCIFVVTYLVFLIITSTTTDYDAIGTRLLSPVFAPMQMILFPLVSRKTDFIGITGKSSQVNILLLATLVGCLIGPIRSTVALHLDMRDHGKYWSGATWKNSEIISALLRNHAIWDGTMIFSNAPDFVYLRVGHATQLSPQKTVYDAQQKAWIPNELRLQGRWPVGDKALLVWFDRFEQNDCLTPNELRQAANLKEIDRFADGAIYLVSKKLLSR